MKLEILLIALLCTVKATGKVNDNLLNVEEGGSGTDNDTLIKSIEKIDGGSKKQIDDTDSSIGSGDDEDSESSGSGDEVEISGSGKGPTDPLKVSTTVSSHTVVVINYGSTGTAATTVKASTAKKDAKETTTPFNMDDDIDNYVEPTQRNVNPVGDNANEIPEVEKSTDPQSSSGVNFTVAIIVGVVVGAILSILIIVFLVYRLRKKDEGSYSLDEPSSAMLTADTDSPPPKGKGEYFA